MSATSLARFTAVCRLLIGSGFLLLPEIAMRPWIGQDAPRPTSRLLARVVGSRDVVIAVGTLTAADSLPRWLAAALAADATDALLTIMARDHLPPAGAALVVAISGGGVALGAAALAGTARSRNGTKELPT